MSGGLFSAETVAIWIERHLWAARGGSIPEEQEANNAGNCARTAKVLVEHTEGTQRRYAKGEVIVKAFDESDSMFLIEKGSVKVTSADGTEVYTVLNIPGTGFGEWGLLTCEKRTATVLANDDNCVMRQLPREVYSKIASANPSFVKILEKVALGKWNSAISKNGSKAESRKSQIIGRNGYKTTIHSLPSSLARFNGTSVCPTRLKQRSSNGALQFEVTLEDKLVLVVGEDKMDVTLDVESVFTPAKVVKKKQGRQTHKSVKFALQDVCSQLRTAILRVIAEGSINVQQVFAQFDIPGTG